MEAGGSGALFGPKEASPISDGNEMTPAFEAQEAP